MEPVVRPRTQHDHRSPTGILGVLRELPTDPDRLRGGHAGDLLLPRRGVRRGIVVTGRPFTGQTLPAHAVLGEHEVEDGRHQAFAAGGPDRHDRHAAPVDVAAF